MADTAEESPAQKQARLRREKRNAKIAAEGSDRLAKITGVSGRPPPVPEKETAQRPAAASPAADPEEVDISEHHWDPNTLRPASSITQKPLPRTPMGDASASSDPMMQMMQQMMASMPGGPGIGASGDGSGGPGPFPNDPMGGAPPPDGLPPFLQAMLAGQQRTNQQAQSQPPPSDSAYVWRVVHAVLALALAGYIVLATPFTGTKLARFADEEEEQAAGKRLFYIFATVETVLQSSRYFIEGGRLSGTGWLATIANSGIVPEPFGGYLKITGRYAAIWSTLVADATTVVFVLGAVVWWRNLGVA